LLLFKKKPLLLAKRKRRKRNFMFYPELTPLIERHIEEIFALLKCWSRGKNMERERVSIYKENGMKREKGCTSLYNGLMGWNYFG